MYQHIREGWDIGLKILLIPFLFNSNKPSVSRNFFTGYFGPKRGNFQRDRSICTVYYTSPQSFIITFSYSLAQHLWTGVILCIIIEDQSSIYRPLFYPFRSLGNFVNHNWGWFMVVHWIIFRWWEQYKLIPWPDTMGLLNTALTFYQVPGLAILTINSTENHETFVSMVGVYLVLCNWRVVGKKGMEKGKGVVGKFSFRIVCQNHIPFSLIR